MPKQIGRPSENQYATDFCFNFQRPLKRVRIMNTFVEIPASINSLSKRRAIYGIGINDSKYITNPKINGRTVTCPYYRVWNSMFARCYSKKLHSVRPTYTECLVVKEWHTFSVFKAWMIKQDWQGKELDKDILVVGNKIYSPSTCIFIDSKTNNLLASSMAARGEFPQGVSFDRESGRYRSYCSVDGRLRNLGRYATVKMAEARYLEFKSSLIEKAAANSGLVARAALLRHASIMRERLALIS